MSPIEIRWQGLACCEFSVDRPPEPTLFRQLGWAAERIRTERLADGVVTSYGAVAAYWQQPPVDYFAVAEPIVAILSEGLRIDASELVSASEEHQVTVRYDGPDLQSLASHLQLDPREIVLRHTMPEYIVAAVGFLPHFAYLWGMDESLSAPRLSSPRVRVPVGSVGIAGNQTGIYPQQSPGGWQLIGHVDPKQCERVCPMLKIGDVVRFQDVL